MDSQTDTSDITSVYGICKHVLLVDSNPSSREFTEMMLLAENYTVTATESGIEALAILDEDVEGVIDFVLTDIHLSDIEGFEFLDILQKESNAIVFVLSADYRLEVVERSFSKGVFTFYEKPIKKEHIDKLWRTALMVKRTRQSVRKGKGKLPYDDRDNKEQFTGKWTSSLHDKFVEAVKEIGLKYVDAKKILEFMDVPGLTKKHVSEHLRICFDSLMKMEQEAFDQQAQENIDCFPSSKRARIW